MEGMDGGLELGTEENEEEGVAHRKVRQS